MRWALLLWAVVGTVLVLGATVQAGVVFSDDFAAGPGDWKSAVDANTQFTSAPGSIGMENRSSGTATGHVFRTFDPIDLTGLNVGDYVLFEARATPTNSRGMVFGLFDSNGQGPVATSGSVDQFFNSYRGASLGIRVKNRTHAFWQLPSSSPPGGTGKTLLGGSEIGGDGSTIPFGDRWNPGESADVTFRLTKTAGGFDVSGSLDEANGSKVDLGPHALSIAPGSLDTVAFGWGTNTSYLVDADGTFTLDEATLTVIPEPVSVVLLGLGGLAVLRRR